MYIRDQYGCPYPNTPVYRYIFSIAFLKQITLHIAVVIWAARFFTLEAGLLLLFIFEEFDNRIKLRNTQQHRQNELDNCWQRIASLEKNYSREFAKH